MEEISYFSSFLFLFFFLSFFPSRITIFGLRGTFGDLKGLWLPLLESSLNREA